MSLRETDESEDAPSYFRRLARRYEAENPFAPRRHYLDDPIPLLDLAPANVEKIVRKIDSKSFRRLQRTSWDMWGFVQKNSKVSVFTEGDFFLKIRREEEVSATSDPFYFTSTKIRPGFREINPKGLYASRLEKLEITGLTSQQFQPLCDFLQKYRISCDKLVLGFIEWQREEYQRLLEILKPVSVEQVNCRFNAFEGLYSSQILENVSVAVDFDSAAGAANKFLSTCQRINITVPCNEKDVTERLELLKTILLILLSEPKPKLQHFSFIVHGEQQELPSEEKLKKELEDFNLKEVYEKGNEAYAIFKLSERYYPPGSVCTLFLRKGGSTCAAGEIVFLRIRQEKEKTE